jgi:hypothetical protein
MVHQGDESGLSEQDFNVAVRWARSVANIFKILGTEKTLEVAKAQGERNGAAFVDGLKQMGGFTPENMAKLIDQAYLPMGLINIETKVTPTTLVMTNGKCPIYEGFKMAGRDDEAIGKQCEIREAAVHAKIAEAFPEVTVNFTRNKPDGPCVTVFKVEK